MRESHAIIAIFLVESRQVLPLFDTQRGVKKIWGVKHLPQLLLSSCLDVENKMYLLLPLLPHLPLHPNRAIVFARGTPYTWTNKILVVLRKVNEMTIFIHIEYNNSGCSFFDLFRNLVSTINFNFINVTRQVLNN